MHCYRAAALTPCKTLRLCSSALLPWAPECDYAAIYHSLVKIQIKAASCAAAARAGAVGAPGRSLGHGPPAGHGTRPRGCCSLLPGAWCWGEHSVLYCVSGKKDSPWKWSKNLFRQERSDSIRVGPHGCLYLSSLKEIAHTAPLLRV